MENTNKSTTAVLTDFFNNTMQPSELANDLTGLFMNCSLMALKSVDNDTELGRQLFSLKMLIDVLNTSQKD